MVVTSYKNEKLTYSDGLVTHEVNYKEPKKKDLFLKCSCDSELLRLWSWNRSRDIKTYKKFLGYNFLWDTKTEWYKELKTEMFMSSKDWKDSLELEGSELFDLVKNAVEEKILKQQKEQLEKLCNGN